MNTTNQTKPAEKVTKELMHTFVNLMYAGWSSEVVKHKMGISQEIMEAIHQAYFNKAN